MGPTTTRKQREIEEREALILDIAREMLVERGYLGLTMDRVAEATEYSKGTIYQHFSSKEDLIAALEMQTMERRSQMFHRASAFQGRPRERIYAIGVAEELFVQLHPHHFRSEQIIHLSSIKEKASEHRQQFIQACMAGCHAIVTAIIRDAIAQKDLELGPEFSPDTLSFTLWSLYSGTFAIMDRGLPLDQLGIADPVASLRRQAHVLLDGHGWLPLFNEWDYEASRERILKEVFSDEIRQIQSS